MSPASPIAVSSPGKVLIAGGYLVVDRSYTGLAFGLSARIHAHISSLTGKDNGTTHQIIVKSPQFRSAHWVYNYRFHEGTVTIQQDRSSLAPTNKFVETVLNYALTYISNAAPAAIVSPSLITILADTAYYSHASTSTSNAMNPSSAFLNFNVSLSDAHKTGLGSSAALVTSLVAALLKFYLPPDHAHALSLDTEAGQRRAHNLAQLAHCSAQGKVGSGFDVAAAVYGSCLYRRFSPSVIDGLSPTDQDFGQKLVGLVEDVDQTMWDTGIQSSGTATMAANLRLYMCDVDCGSETPGMVKQIFAWRKKDRESANRIWDELQGRNETLASLLLHEQPALEDEERKEKITRTLSECRSLIREMTHASGVPVEPKTQTDLLDACSKLEGVLGGVVPGAGGYDALVLIAEDTQSTKTRLESLLESYEPAADEQGPKIGKVKLLEVMQEMQGVRSEDETLYQGWI